MNKYEKALDTINELIERDLLDAYSKAPLYDDAMRSLTELVAGYGNIMEKESDDHKNKRI